jgi:predicted HAD superfamily hydrolase
MVWQYVVKYKMKMLRLKFQDASVKTTVLYMTRSKYAVIRTSKWSIQRTLRIIENVNERFKRRVQPCHHQENSHGENRIVEACERQLPPCAVLLLPVQMQK